MSMLQRCRKVLKPTKVRELDNYSLHYAPGSCCGLVEPLLVIGSGLVERANVKSMLHNNGKLSRIYRLHETLACCFSYTCNQGLMKVCHW